MQVITLLVLAFAVVLVVALLKIQVLNHQDMAKAASGQYYSNQVEPARRGSIYDRNGVKLASTSFVYRVGITPEHVYSRAKKVTEDQILQRMSEDLKVDRADLDQAMADKTASYVQIAKNVPEEAGKNLEAFLEENYVGGVRMDKEPKRYYTNGDLASQILGFASYQDGKLEGRLGVELAFNDLLSGAAGYSYAARDNYLSHGLLPYAQSQDKPAKDGYEFYLTLDMNIQEILQRDLEDAIKAYDAVEDGMGIVMNPYNGEILAMASYPYFRSDDPTAKPLGIKQKDWDPGDEKTIQWLQEHAWRNKNISSLYEAGSTMKALTAAMAFEENICTELTPYNDDPIQVLDAEISCWTGHGHGTESVEQAFWNSCNPVFVQMALGVGVDRFYDYIRSFGFYEETGLGLPGEAACIFHTNPSILDMANLSFGESSGVTPMHLMKAFAALVNGGKLVTPSIVREVRSQDGQVLETSSPQVSRRVISAETSSRVRKLMAGMVENSANFTNTWGYQIGGKTSTSVDEVTNQVTVSFVAAAPIDHPEIMVLMILQKPSSKDVAGTEAQIVTQNTASKILDYLNVDRSYSDLDVYKMAKSILTPDLGGQTLSQAASSLTYEQVQVVAGDTKTLAESIIKYQIPLPGTLIYPGSNIYVYSKKPEATQVIIPDLSQMNYNEVISACNSVGLTPQFEGSLTGNCVAQKMAYPDSLPEGSEGKPGDLAEFGSVIKVALQMPTTGQ
ncbi:MAG: penicillin-binding transpeptidase domain-containing protein [Eubacteriales bacterium]|nr:penicillin-binding transpeptidase domain-containing protein [Clostridiales bacterium]MDY5835601.1 penicillin-binding transpeptidase domain-containing protein [Eubacteriales bacterium]